MKLNIGVVFGSRTCEHDVSVISGLQAAQALDRESYDVTLIYIGRDGRWFLGDALKDIKFYPAFDETKVAQVFPAGENGKLVLYRLGGKKKLFGGQALEKAAAVDVVLPVMHGLNGEDGTLQGMLELFNVPFASAGVLGSAVGMDKIAMKLLFKGCGFPVVEGIWFNRDRWSRERDSVMDEAERAIGYPMIVKPANLGSSIGITRATDRKTLEDAVDTAVAYDHRILVERAITPLREVNCSVLGYGDDVETSELEMPLTGNPVLDFKDKYFTKSGGGEGMASLARVIPAPIPEDVADKIRALSVAAFRAMDLKGVVRIDFILDGDDGVYINEANTIPGSLAFYLWEPKGVPFAQLLDGMIVHALKAHADRNGSVFSYDSEILKRLIAGSKGAKGAKFQR
ncbi:MAG: D-alanine--D-alanine ligase [Clostridiales bacterium]|nr:D-alanine--D-alanine ligase [Clostridiales bacterium]